MNDRMCHRVLYRIAPGLLVAAVALAGTAVTAQPVNTDRLSRELWGHGDTNPNHEFGVTWSLFGAYDDNVTADTRSYNPATQLSGSFATASTRVGYASRSEEKTLIVNGALNGRYYPQLQSLNALDGGADVSFSTLMGRDTRVSFSQAAQYLPYYQFNLLTNLVPSPETRQPRQRTDVLGTQPSHEYDGRVELVQQMGTQASFAVNYGYRYSTLAGYAAPFTWQLAGARYSRRTSRYTNLRLGYSYSQANDGAANAAPVVNHNIDIGLDFSRPLSASRRTRFAASTGTSVVSYLGKDYYRLIADATLTRDIGRTWATDLLYHRGVQYVEGVAGPLYADTVQLRLRGFISKRVDFSAATGYSNGQIGFSAVDRGYATYLGVASLRVALGHMLWFETQYGYYYYDFATAAAIPAGVPPNLNRQGIRIGLTGWVPFFRR